MYRGYPNNLSRLTESIERLEILDSASSDVERPFLNYLHVKNQTLETQCFILDRLTITTRCIIRSSGASKYTVPYVRFSDIT